MLVRHCKIVAKVKAEKKVLFLFDYACHPLPGTMLIFSVNLAVCVMPSPKTGPTASGDFVYIYYSIVFATTQYSMFYGVPFENSLKV